MKIGTSYFGNRILRHVKQDMEQLVKQGFNLVVHTFNENDMLFYHSTMKDIVQISKDAGLEVQLDPWGVGKVFGGESFSNFVACNLDAVQILSDDKPAGMACPMNPKFRAFMIEWIEMALSFEPDMIFWDEPHFCIPNWLGSRPNQWGCRCSYCQEHFREKFGKEMPKEKTDETNAYIEWGIHDFLTFVIGESFKRGGKNNLCLLPHDEGTTGAINCWDSFASIPGLQCLGTDPYFSLQKLPFSHVEKFSKIAKAAADKYGLDCQIWHQGFKIPAGEEEMQGKAVQTTYECGITNQAVWGFEACDHMAWIRPDNPEKLWKIFIDNFADVKAKG